MAKFVTIHGHFYQPPRENPWYGQIEVQDSAAPWHDWNERVNYECYSRNASSRILDSEAKIKRIVNNYSRISFNFGPTLLSWAEQKAPLLLKSLREADELSRKRFSGHGSAIAQVYNHIIMPLANRRDKITQVRWGMADFENRFGRRTEGMWLAETAADSETLEILSENGIVFTILSPYQALSVRKFGTDKWIDVNGGRIDTSRPYRCYLPSGRYIDIFFYNGALSQAIAFQGLLNDGGTYARKLMESIPNDTENRLAHVATDGESYGHHHKHGDMALAYALDVIDKAPQAALTVYGEFLENNPPQYGVKIVENSSWSCAHGVERWRSDCGCNSGTGYHQKWRRPLRNALDWLRDSVMPDFENSLRKFFDDPWGARDAYIEIVLDHSPDKLDDWLFSHSGRPLDTKDAVKALRLLELQRNALLMYTSCGWFFDDIAGIETVQILCYAARVIELAKRLFGKDLEEEFKKMLALAPGNTQELPDGSKVYEKMVEPLSSERIAAQAAIYSLVVGEPYHQAKIDIIRSENERHCTGTIMIDSILSLGARPFFFAARLTKTHNMICGVTALNERNYDELKAKFFSSQSFDNEELLRSTFGTDIFSFQHLIKDMRQFLLTSLIEEETLAIQNGVRRMLEKYEDIISFMGKSEVMLPRVIQDAAGIILNADIENEFTAKELNISQISSCAEKAHEWGVSLDMRRICYSAAMWLIEKMHLLEESCPNTELTEQIISMLEVSLEKYHWNLGLSEAQNTYYRIISEMGVRNEGRILRLGELLKFSSRMLEE